MYFHFLQTGYLSDRNLESLSVCLLLIINTWRGTVKKVCPKVLELWTIFFFKYTTLECKGSGLIFFGSQFLSTWLLPKFRKGSCLLFWSSCSGWPRHKVEREGDLRGQMVHWRCQHCQLCLGGGPSSWKPLVWTTAIFSFAGNGSTWAGHNLVGGNIGPGQRR